MIGLKHNTTCDQWFILRGEIKFGPFDYRSVIQMLQKSELFEYNYMWAPHLENWTLLGDLPDFSKDRFCRILESNDEMASAFTKRSSTRAEILVPIHGHDNQRYFDGHIISISKDGALVLLNDPLLVPGQKILLHFQESEKNQQPFNVFCEVVRKNFTKTRLNVKSGLHYVVRFLQLHEQGKNQILNWTRTSVAKEEKNGIF
jgi:hypothetical protein